MNRTPETESDRRPKDLPEEYAEQATRIEQNPSAELVLQAVHIGELGLAANHRRTL